LKDIIFFCDAYGRGALVRALFHLQVLDPGQATAVQLCRLTWWKRIDRLAPGQVLEVGRDARGNRIFVLWVKKDKELLPRLARTLAAASGRPGRMLLVDALEQNNWKTHLARFLARIFGRNLLSHYLFLSGLKNITPSSVPAFPRTSQLDVGPIMLDNEEDRGD